MNQAESIIHDTETKMEEFKDQLPTDEVRCTILSLVNTKLVAFASCDLDIQMELLEPRKICRNMQFRVGVKR